MHPPRTPSESPPPACATSHHGQLGRMALRCSAAALANAVTLLLMCNRSLPLRPVVTEHTQRPASQEAHLMRTNWALTRLYALAYTVTSGWLPSLSSLLCLSFLGRGFDAFSCSSSCRCISATCVHKWSLIHDIGCTGVGAEAVRQHTWVWWVLCGSCAQVLGPQMLSCCDMPKVK